MTTPLCFELQQGENVGRKWGEVSACKDALDIWVSVERPCLPKPLKRLVILSLFPLKPIPRTFHVTNLGVVMVECWIFTKTVCLSVCLVWLYVSVGVVGMAVTVLYVYVVNSSIEAQHNAECRRKREKMWKVTKGISHPIQFQFIQSQFNQNWIRRVVILISTFPHLGHVDKDEGSKYISFSFLSWNFILLKSVNCSILLFSAKDKNISISC